MSPNLNPFSPRQTLSTQRRRPAALAAAALFAMFFAVVGAAAAKADDEKPRVRLVLQITIDQLRDDTLLRDRRLWGKGGFARLFDQGVFFADANHAHANTETIVGHATLATGADPSVHGMIGNAWFDRKAGKMRYNVEDAAVDLVGNDKAPAAAKPDAAAMPASPAPASPAAPAAASGKPSEAAKKIRGRSPVSLLAPTLADSIAAAGSAKVFAVSLKDRGAVPMAGRAGKALWWSDASGEFVSSTYYYPDRRLPAWASKWNDAHLADAVDGRSWNLLLGPRSYARFRYDDRPWELPPTGMGRTFPHRFDRRALGEGYYGALAASPFGDDLLLDFARSLIAAEKLGDDDDTDYLSVSFSSCDWIGHRYGPSSLEMEDEILRLDRTIAALLAAADAAAGPGNILVILSSDHGVAEVPDDATAGHGDSRKIVLSKVLASPPVVALKEKFGGSLVREAWSPSVYLDTDALVAHHVDPAQAARELAALIAAVPGIEAVFTRQQIESGKLPDTVAARAVRRGFFAERSGDLTLVVKRGWQMAYEGADALRYATGHGTPWPYDTRVPLVFAGPGVAHGVVSRPVETTDAAPTAAALAGIPPPARATGHVLVEALRRAR